MPKAQRKAPLRNTTQAQRAFRKLCFTTTQCKKLTHYVFRYPAKFHPPVARTLIEKYTHPEDVILDPFCGSGTLAVEAAAAGRHSLGIDVDPVAVFVSQVKTRRLNCSALRRSWKRLSTRLAALQRPASEYVRRQHNDVTHETALRTVRQEGLWLPNIPNISHWFRNYVLVDLARIYSAILRARDTSSHIDFFRLCFAAIVRNSSNADPVPVSGLEVTSHMKRRDELGRIVNPFDLFERSVEKSIVAIEEFCDTTSASVTSRFRRADATNLSAVVKGRVDAVITSPPYHSAVDYYRRHTLEMYWLGLTTTREERLRLLPRYIGRGQVPKNHEFVHDGTLLAPMVRRWDHRLRKVSAPRADAFKHYAVAMQRVFEQLSKVLAKNASAVFVVGKSKWGDTEIPTHTLFEEMADGKFEITERLSYPVKDRYMSYSRRNGADINKEFVLVMRRK